MAIYEFEGKKPVIGKGSFVMDTASVIGDVMIGEDCYIGAGAVIRGDYGAVKIGSGTAVEDNCVLHARPEGLLTIGKEVTLGHGTVLHNCTIDDFAVIGMGAVVSDHAHVGIWSVVGEGAVVKNKSDIPDGKIAVGVPAKVIADVSEQYREQWGHFKKLYQGLARDRYPVGLRKTE